MYVSSTTKVCLLLISCDKQVSVAHDPQRRSLHATNHEWCFQATYTWQRNPMSCKQSHTETILGCSHSQRAFGKETFETITFCKRTPLLGSWLPSKGHHWEPRKGKCLCRIQLASLCSQQFQAPLSFSPGPQGTTALVRCPSPATYKAKLALSF